MGALDQVTQMKSQGMSDQQIIQTLQQQGIPPKDIQDALGQAQIKTAVAGPPRTIGGAHQRRSRGQGRPRSTRRSQNCRRFGWWADPRDAGGAIDKRQK